jgi:hypothetical protein
MSLDPDNPAVTNAKAAELLCVHAQALGMEKVCRVLPYYSGQDGGARSQQELCGWVPSTWHHFDECFHLICHRSSGYL